MGLTKDLSAKKIPMEKMSLKAASSRTAASSEDTENFLQRM